MGTRDPELTRLLVQELKRHLLAIVEDIASGGDLEPTRRAVHALKGSSGLAGEPELAAAMLRIERRLRQGEKDALVEVVATIERAIAGLSSGGRAVDGGWPVPPVDLVPRTLEPIVRAQYVAEVTDRLAQIDGAIGTGGDPIDVTTAVYRHVHTMKGAASAAGDEPMAWFCHGLEEKIRGSSNSNEAAIAAFEEVARYRAVLGGLLDDPENALATLRGVPLRQSTSRRDTGRIDEVDDATIRVSALAVDRLLDHVTAVTVARERVAAKVVRGTQLANMTRRLRAELSEALRLIGPPRPWGAPAAALRRIERTSQTLIQIGDELERGAGQLEVSNQALRDSTAASRKILSAMRQTPFRGLFARLSSAALAEARRTGRMVSVHTQGAEETIDRRLSEQLLEPCLQLTRNAIAHGIETPDEREAMGKPRVACLTFSARRQDGRLVVVIGDDGKGVDVAVVRARALESGLVTDVLAEAADDQTLLELLFLPGFSTRGQSPDLLAGRGIGLDITLAAVQRLGGTIRLSSTRGKGFDARVDIPVESGLASVLWVTAGGLEHALPVAYARRVRVNDGPDADRIPNLAACLEHQHSARAPLRVDLDMGLESEVVAIGVDAVGVTEEVLVRELTPLLRTMGPFAGAVVRGDGSLRLALDVLALAPRARALGRVPEGRVSERPPASRP